MRISGRRGRPTSCRRRVGWRAARAAGVAGGRRREGGGNDAASTRRRERAHGIDAVPEEVRIGMPLAASLTTLRGARSASHRRARHTHPVHEPPAGRIESFVAPASGGACSRRSRAVKADVTSFEMPQPGPSG